MAGACTRMGWAGLEVMAGGGDGWQESKEKGTGKREGGGSHCWKPFHLNSLTFRRIDPALSCLRTRRARCTPPQAN